MKVVFAGNPNVGKTSLFNRVTGSFEHVGNYPGVTVQRKAKTTKIDGEEYEFVDLPGLYSLNARSAEEVLAANELRSKNADVVVVVCEVNNLCRNLYLATQIFDLGIKTVLAVNMMDELPRGRKFDAEKLAERLGVAVVPVSAKYRKGSENLIKEIKRARVPRLHKSRIYTDVRREAAERYSLIDSVTEGVFTGKKVSGVCAFDKIVLNKYLALPVFLIIMAAIFFVTFGVVGKFLCKGIQYGVEQLSQTAGYALSGSPDWLNALISQGIIGGVGGVLAFLPQVVLLYFFIGLLEDSGYISRVAFMTDDLFGKIGLSCRAAFTLIMGFGCSATAIVTARGLDDANMRVKTVMLTPFMSCSAKMPVFSAITAAYFNGNPLVIFAMYLLGVTMALVCAAVMQKTPLKSKNDCFVMELPPYRVPTFERLFQLVGSGVKSFVVKIGGSVFCLSVLAWILCNFSLARGFVLSGEGSIMQTFASIIAPIFRPLGFGNWKAVAALLSGLVAKESVITVIGGFGGVSAVLGYDQAMPFMVFALLYVPCVASLGVTAKEIGAKYAVISAASQFAIAYVVAFAVRACMIYEFLLAIAIVAVIIVLTVRGIIKFSGRCRNCASCGKCK